MSRMGLWDRWDRFRRGKLNREATTASRAVPDAPSLPERDDWPNEVSHVGAEIIHRYEGFAEDLGNGTVRAYPDPGTGGKPWTIGYGSTTDENLKPIQPGTVWTHERAKARSALDLKRFADQVADALGEALPGTSQLQFDALVSFAYNVGMGNLRRSTLLRKHKAGDYEGAANEFVRWNRAAGRVMRGLTRRRKEEAKLYRRGS